MRSRWWPVAVALLLVAGACDVSRPEVLPPPPDTGPPPVYVSVGASETTGVGSDQPLRDAWPRVLHRTALALVAGVRPARRAARLPAREAMEAA